MERCHNLQLGPIDTAAKEFVPPLVERATATAGFNEPLPPAAQPQEN